MALIEKYIRLAKVGYIFFVPSPTPWVAIYWRTYMYTLPYFCSGKRTQKMDTTTLIGLGLSAALLLKQDQSDEDLKKQIENLKDDLAAQESYFDDKLKDADKTDAEFIKKNIAVGCNLTFCEVTGAKRWRGKFTWQIRNDSQDQTFIVFKEKAVFTLYGNRCTLFVPCATDQFTLTPGKLVECSSTWQDKMWFDGSGIRGSIQKPLRNNLGKWLQNGELIADISIKFGTAGDAATKVVTWENVTGAVRLEKGGIYSYGNKGYNGASKDW